jgi:membrane fusion protein, copper/silver efflux system
MKQGLSKNAGLVVAVVIALAAGYGLHAWLAPDSKAPEGAELWVCSMNNNPHAYYSSDRPGKCKYCGMDLILADADDAGLGPRELVMSERARVLAGIETTRVERREAVAEVRMAGMVEYDETRLSYITAWVPGRIDRLFVNYTGVSVKPGQHMVELYSPELLGAQEEVIQAAKAVKELNADAPALVRESAESTLDATRKKLELLGLAAKQIAAIEKRGKASDRVTIFAPTGGVVIEKGVKQGKYVRTGTRIYTIADLSKVWVKFDAYEADLAWVRVGQDVTFTTEAYAGEEFSGQIAFVAPVVNAATRTIQVRATVPNADGRLKPKMLVRGVVRAKLTSDGGVINDKLAGKWLCSMHPDVVKDIAGACDTCEMPLVRAESLGYVAAGAAGKPLMIPASAPLLTGRRAVVYVKVPDKKEPTYAGREVTLGPRAGDWYIVKSGLAEGDEIVSKGAFRIDSDLQIQGRQAMMSPKGGGAPVHQHGSGSKHEGSGGKPPAQAPAAFQNQLSALLRAYFTMGAALANDDAAAATASGGAVVDAMAAIDMKLLDRAGHAAWMKELPSLRRAVAGFAAATDIAAQRAAFALLSEEMPVLVKRFGVGKMGPVYRAHCPMAFNNRGADWLQDKKAVRNPYYGAGMLKCGAVTETLVDVPK